MYTFALPLAKHSTVVKLQHYNNIILYLETEYGFKQPAHTLKYDMARFLRRKYLHAECKSQNTVTLINIS